METHLRAAGRPEGAEAQRAYLKSRLEFWGTPLGEIRRLVRDLIRAEAPLSYERLVGLVEQLWARPVHELRTSAVFLLQATPYLLTAGDLALLEALIRESFTWAYVDGLAGDVAGRLNASDPDGARPVLDRWAGDDDFWVRRSALLAMLIPLKAGPAPFGPTFAQFTGYAEAMLEESEFFIRKAIGWVLREVGKREPAPVAAWLEPRTGRASGVTMREAVKYLDPQDRDRLMAAYRQTHRHA